MMDCNEARELLALQPTSEDDALQSHLAQCDRCVRYRRPQQALDVVLRSELQWQVPAALTQQLLALTMAHPRPKRWYVVVVYLLTATAIGLSLAVAWQFFGLLAAQIGLGTALAEALTVPGQWLDQLTQALPVSPAALQFLLKAREQLLWLLLVAVLWAVVDKWNPQFSLRPRQTSS